MFALYIQLRDIEKLKSVVSRSLPLYLQEPLVGEVHDTAFEIGDHLFVDRVTEITVQEPETIEPGQIVCTWCGTKTPNDDQLTFVAFDTVVIDCVRNEPPLGANFRI